MSHRAALFACMIAVSTTFAADPTTRPAESRNPLMMAVPEEFRLDAAPLAQAIDTFAHRVGERCVVERDGDRRRQRVHLVRGAAGTSASRFGSGDRGGVVGSARELARQLIITQTPETHRAIADWLRQQNPLVVGDNERREFPILSTKITTTQPSR